MAQGPTTALKKLKLRDNADLVALVREVEGFLNTTFTPQKFAPFYSVNDGDSDWGPRVLNPESRLSREEFEAHLTYFRTHRMRRTLNTLHPMTELELYINNCNVDSVTGPVAGVWFDLKSPEIMILTGEDHIDHLKLNTNQQLFKIVAKYATTDSVQAARAG